MTSAKLINLILIIIAITGSLYTLYSIFLRTIKNEFHKMEDDLLKKIKHKA
jgi:hypothetical protein